MKKVLPILLIAVLLLSGCGIINPAPSEPTPSDEQLATRVADILTAMPTPTVPPQPTVAATVALPTEEPTAEPTATEEPTAEPTATPTQKSVMGPEMPPTGTVQSEAKPSKTPKPATPTPPPTSTLPPTDPRLDLGKPSYSDPMDNGNAWASGVDRRGFTSVDYQDGYMVLTGLKTRSGWRLSRYGMDLQSFYIEMRITPGNCAGDDRYGIIFHVPVPSRPEQGYWYGFTCDGRFAMQKWDAYDGPEGKVTNLVYWKESDAINAGPNQTNRMGLMVSGRRMIMYANGVKLGETSDTTWLQGAFGVFVGARETNNFSVQVDQVDVWQLQTPKDLHPRATKTIRPTRTPTPQD